MPTLADTTIRLLGQEPLAGGSRPPSSSGSPRSSTAPGFAYLEVSGGGCFDWAVKRGVESPWERIRALKSRVKTPLGLALRGRFLVGSRPVDADFARRFVASAAENGIDVFRLHDPLNDVSNLREAAEAIVAADRDFEAGLVYSPGPTGEVDTLIERAKALPRARRRARAPARPDRLAPAAQGASSSSARSREASGLPVGIYVPGLGRQRARCDARGRARRRAADRVRDLPARADAAPRLRRGARGGARRAWASTRASTCRRSGRRPTSSTSTSATSPSRRSRRASPSAPRSTTCRRASSPALDATCARRMRATGSTRCSRSSTQIRAEVGWPPLAAPIGQVLALAGAAQRALREPLPRRSSTSCARSSRGRFGTPPEPIDPAVVRAVELHERPRHARRTSRRRSSELRAQAEGMAASEEELLLLGLFGEDAERLLQTIRGRASADEDELASVDKARAERIRELVRIVQETGIGEVTIEEDGMRVSRARARSEPRRPRPAAAPLALPSRRRGAASRAVERPRRASSRRWSATSTARPSPARRRSSRRATSSPRARRSASSRR